jgi:hypothetical protein
MGCQILPWRCLGKECECKGKHLQSDLNSLHVCFTLYKLTLLLLSLWHLTEGKHGYKQESCSTMENSSPRTGCYKSHTHLLWYVLFLWLVPDSGEPAAANPNSQILPRQLKYQQTSASAVWRARANMQKVPDRASHRTANHSLVSVSAVWKVNFWKALKFAICSKALFKPDLVIAKRSWSTHTIAWSI